MSSNLENKYNDLVSNNLITYDKKQIDLLNQINEVWIKS